MGFGVFIHRQDSIYDDSPAVQYQFPAQYRKRAEACIGDWIIYYEPTKVRASRGYHAVAKVESVERDPTSPGMFLAVIDEGSYLPFTRPVPFTKEGTPIELGVLNKSGRISGRAQSAIRPLSSLDFRRIVSAGFPDSDDVLPRTQEADETSNGFEDEQVPFEVERDKTQVLLSRPARDRVFRRVVLRAYGERCAVTGFKFINGGGRAEVEAAHIRSVEASGPDIVNNGLALSGTVHWMFDRGLISVADSCEILISRQVNDREGVEALINPTGRLIGPAEERDRPHPMFLQWHRENCFKT